MEPRGGEPHQGAAAVTPGPGTFRPGTFGAAGTLDSALEQRSRWWELVCLLKHELLLSFRSLWGWNEGLRLVRSPAEAWSCPGDVQKHS